MNSSRNHLADRIDAGGGWKDALPTSTLTRVSQQSLGVAHGGFRARDARPLPRGDRPGEGDPPPAQRPPAVVAAVVCRTEVEKPTGPRHRQGATRCLVDDGLPLGAALRRDRLFEPRAAQAPWKKAGLEVSLSGPRLNLDDVYHEIAMLDASLINWSASHAWPTRDCHGFRVPAAALPSAQAFAASPPRAPSRCSSAYPLAERQAADAAAPSPSSTATWDDVHRAVVDMTIALPPMSPEEVEGKKLGFLPKIVEHECGRHSAGSGSRAGYGPASAGMWRAEDHALRGDRRLSVEPTARTERVSVPSLSRLQRHQSSLW